MKQVWQCDFCCQAGTLENISKHEPTCLFDPAKKTCQSCENHVFDRYDMHTSCEVLVYTEYFEMYESEQPCPHWKPEA